jgi:hypothetical protein
VWPLIAARLAVVAAATCLFFPACGGIAAESLATGPADSSSDVVTVPGLDGSFEALAEASGAIGLLWCPYGIGDAGRYPDSTGVTYDKSCMVAADCTIGLHYWDCCGAPRPVGAIGACGL